MLSVEEIKSFIQNDAASQLKKQAREGDRYYDGKHDIRKYRIFYFDADGKLQEDKTRSNIKISHPFFTEHVDQETQYILSGKEAIFRSDIPELQEYLDEYFNENEDYLAELYDTLENSSKMGFGYMYAYKKNDGSNGKTSFKCADSLGVVEVREEETEDHCKYVIYWTIDRIGKDNKKIKRIQVWDEKQTWYYVQQNEGAIVLDKSKKYNPRPHILYTKDGDENTYFENFGCIPFFSLDNNKKRSSGLKPIKDLIDDYDIMNCGLSDNIQDTAEALYIVKGFKGNNLDELMTNIKAKKHIGVSENGGVDIKTIDIPYEARQAKMELDEKNIYRFGMAFNSSQLGDGNITNIVIRSRYTLLDLKCHKKIIRLKQFFRKQLKIVLDEINTEHGTDYQQKDVYFVIEPEIPTNELENAQIALAQAQTRQAEINILLDLAQQLGNEKMMELIAEQLDLDWEELKSQIPKPEEDDLFDLKTIPTVPNKEGGVIE